MSTNRSVLQNQVYSPAFLGMIIFAAATQACVVLVGSICAEFKRNPSSQRPHLEQLTITPEEAIYPCGQAIAAGYATCSVCSRRT